MYMNLRGTIVSVVSFLIFTAPVMAVTSPKELRAEIAASRTAAAKETVKEKREEVRLAAKERWEELKNAREASWEAKRAEVKTTVQEKREAVKARLTAISDERKKKIIERIQEKLGNMNEQRTGHFQKVLERLSTILDKITSRTEKAKAEGKNVTGVESAIASARSFIATAEDAVAVQKNKIYQVTATSDSTAKNEVGSAVKQLQSDLQSVQKIVEDARSAVHNVYTQIKSVAAPAGTATDSGVMP